ncbi:MAG TPA: GGDEF domain-containing protein [Noviherbaspirillum sp.]|uniref:GGDEF domain-containing protein n=1 Tax=Noviherbaspirillum sp. TaxID=1926288 RepID=UPI002D4563E0|nr:GGDEF domain-containing protein [Noviherbaspirillum sp.]HYD93755.1 GGDEF domain-containing protein [Noviherbaspirillum sp.]
MRIPQLSPISLISLLYAVSLYVFYRQGFITGTTFSVVAAIVVVMVVLFYAVFRFGFNTRFQEPSLMLPQLISSLLVMLVVAYLERSTQVALVPFILIAFSFGIFRLSTASLILLAMGCLVAYLGIIIARAQVEGFDFGFRADLAQWAVLALTLPGMILVGKQIQNLRQLLRATRYQLEHYEEKSVRDELTGLYNRRQLQSELQQAKLQADTHSVPFSICLIDIDKFKEINDNNGHLVGDTILKEFSRVARDSIRDTDILGRYGGDEFMQILPDTDVKGAVMHAERLRVYAHFLDFQKILAQKHISLSIGVAQYRPGEKITDLIARADTALYKAKQLGRNRVEWIDA